MAAGLSAAMGDLAADASVDKKLPIGYRGLSLQRLGAQHDRPAYPPDKPAADSYLIALFGSCYNRLSSIFQVINNLYLIY